MHGERLKGLYTLKGIWGWNEIKYEQNWAGPSQSLYSRVQLKAINSLKIELNHQSCEKAGAALSLLNANRYRLGVLESSDFQLFYTSKAVKIAEIFLQTAKVENFFISFILLLHKIMVYSVSTLYRTCKNFGKTSFGNHCWRTPQWKPGRSSDPKFWVWRASLLRALGLGPGSSFQSAAGQ